MRSRKFLLASFGFTQLLATHGMAQNSFEDGLCQVAQDDPDSCEDFGCAQQGGKCEPQQGVDQHGNEIQGCMCDHPQVPEKQCQFVFDHETGAQICVDLECPPMDVFNCNPVSCTCGEPNRYGDKLCQPNQIDPTQCEDLGCAPLGGICAPQEGQLPNGKDQLVCHCEFPPQEEFGDGCEVMFEHDTGAVVCIDLNCGNDHFYECDPAPCTCLCDPAIPPEVLNLRWLSKVKFRWDEALCATVYNVYRKTAPKLPGCGLVACDYGGCLWSALVATNAVDLAVPLPPANVQYYLVTAENENGEGILGLTSGGVIRPNFFACPSPPPPPP